MRLDKYIADTGIASRKECAKAAKAGLVILNGKQGVRFVNIGRKNWYAFGFSVSGILSDIRDIRDTVV